MQIKLTHPVSGHFISNLPLPGGLDPVLTNGQGLTARLFKTQSPMHSLYKLEGFGERIHSETQDLLPTTTDIVYAEHPIWAGIEQSTILSHLRLMIENELLALDAVEGEIFSLAGRWQEARYKSQTYVATVRITRYARAPWAELEVTIQRRNLVKTLSLYSVVLDLPVGIWGLDKAQRYTLQMPIYTGSVSHGELKIVPSSILGYNDNATLQSVFNSIQPFYALPVSWQGDFLGSPVVKGLQIEPHDLTDTDYANQAGNHTSYGVTCSSVLWKKDGSVNLSSIKMIEDSANKYLRYPTCWLEPGTSLPLALTGHPKLTTHKFQPWTQERKIEDMDLIGVFQPNETALPSPDGLTSADNEHITMAPLAGAWVLTGAMRYEKTMRSQMHTEFYNRAVINNWVQPGRGSGRPFSAIAIAGFSDTYCKNMFTQNIPFRMTQMLNAIAANNVSIDLPVQLSSVANFNNVLYGFTCYEQGVLSLGAWLSYKLYGDRNALKLAWISGRTMLTGVRFINGSWHVGYQVPVFTPGVPCDDSYILGGDFNFLSSWALSGARAFTRACAEYRRLGLPFPSEVDLPMWEQRASDFSLSTETWFNSQSIGAGNIGEAVSNLHQTLHGTV